MKLSELLSYPIQEQSHDLNDTCYFNIWETFPEISQINIQFSQFPPQEEVDGELLVTTDIIKHHHFAGMDSSYEWGVRIIRFKGQPALVTVLGGKGGYDIKRYVVDKECYKNLIVYLGQFVIDSMEVEDVIESDDPELPAVEDHWGHSLKDNWEYKNVGY